ncbi:MAG: hydrogenase maturation protease [Methylovirgula sp.]
MLVVIGCGNLNRSDDGAGVAVIRALSESRPVSSDAVKLFDAGTGGMEILFQARGARKLVIVDACTSGSEPGAIFEVPGQELEGPPKQSFNLHDFRWDHALYAGRRIFADQFPDEVTVFLIEAASLDFGLELTPVVQAAVTKVAARIAEIIAAYEHAALVGGVS